MRPSVRLDHVRFTLGWFVALYFLYVSILRQPVRPSVRLDHVRFALGCFVALYLVLRLLVPFASACVFPVLDVVKRKPKGMVVMHKACRVGSKRVKSLTRTKRQYYKAMQAKRMQVAADVANGILVCHVLCCFNLFDAAYVGHQCADTACTGDACLTADASDCEGDVMEIGELFMPEYMVVSEEKEYQQVLGLAEDPTVGSDDDDFQEAPLQDHIAAQLSIG